MPWLPDENFNKKPNSAKKRPEKGQTDCLKARKKPNCICSVAIPLKQRNISITRISNNFLRHQDEVFLGLVLELITDASLTFHDLWDCTLWVHWCHSLHTNPSAASCTQTKVISHTLLYLRPESCKSPSTFSRSLSHFYHGDADLSASVEPGY